MDVPGEKLIIKLWETITDKGIGSLLKPWQIRREGRAAIDLKKEEMLMLAQTQAEIRDMDIVNKVSSINLKDHELYPTVHSDPLALATFKIADLNNRLEAVRREINIAKTIIHAEQDLSNDPQEAPEEKLSDDWLFRWRDCAANISSQDLQSMWGKVLAGEVKAPGTYSLRTLEFLKNLSHDEAKDIEKISPFVIQDFIFRGDKELLESKGVTSSLLLSMEELNIISNAETAGAKIKFSSVSQQSFECALLSYKRALWITHPDPKQTFILRIYKITTLGKQVFSLGKFKVDEMYLKSVGGAIKLLGFDVAIANFSQVNGEKIKLSNMEAL